MTNEVLIEQVYAAYNRQGTDAVISTGTFEHDYLIEDCQIMRLDIRRL